MVAGSPLERLRRFVASLPMSEGAALLFAAADFVVLFGFARDGGMCAGVGLVSFERGPGASKPKLSYLRLCWHDEP